MAEKVTPRQLAERMVTTRIDSGLHVVELCPDGQQPMALWSTSNKANVEWYRDRAVRVLEAVIEQTLSLAREGKIVEEPANDWSAGTGL